MGVAVLVEVPVGKGVGDIEGVGLTVGGAGAAVGAPVGIGVLCGVWAILAFDISKLLDAMPTDNSPSELVLQTGEPGGVLCVAR